jgi:hypothetical protein
MMSRINRALVPLAISILTATTVISCNQKKESNQTAEAKSDSIAEVTATPASLTAKVSETAPDPATIPADKIADVATILGRKQVPILCYHQVREWKPRDSENARSYIMPVQVFKDQIKMLADSGYHSISPDQLYAYLTTGAPLPEKTDHDHVRRW